MEGEPESLRPRQGATANAPSAVADAVGLARLILSADTERLAHSEAVAARAAALTAAVPQEHQPILVAAAWLHDIGYSPSVRQTGFHPVDGARHLRSLGWPDLVCDLVAHHSGSRFVARVRRQEADLEEFHFEEDAVSDALTVADQTVGPGGRTMSVEERLRDMLERHGPDSPNAQAHVRREPYVLAAAVRVAERLEAAGLSNVEERLPLRSARPS